MPGQTKMTAEQRARRNERKRELQRAAMASPEARAHKSKLDRESRQRQKAKDPERVRAKIKEQHRRARNKKLEMDPGGPKRRYDEKLARRAETQRNAILRYEEELASGKPLTRNRQDRLKYLIKALRERPEELCALKSAAWYRWHGMSRPIAKYIMDAVKKNAPPDLVGDIATALTIEVLEGRVPRREVALFVKAEVRKHYRQFDQYKNLSLDAVHPVTGQAWVNNLASDTEHF